MSTGGHPTIFLYKYHGSNTIMEVKSDFTVKKSSESQAGQQQIPAKYKAK